VIYIVSFDRAAAPPSEEIPVQGRLALHSTRRVSGPHSKDAARVARNFVSTYGQDRFEWLISGFTQLKSLSKMSTEINVSRERMSQWRMAFGVLYTGYEVDPSVYKILLSKKAK